MRTGRILFFLLCFLAFANVIYVYRVQFQQAVNNDILADYVSMANGPPVKQTRKMKLPREIAEKLAKSGGKISKKELEKLALAEEEGHGGTEEDTSISESDDKADTVNEDTKKTQESLTQKEPVNSTEAPMKALETEQKTAGQTAHKVAGLSCKAYGGPSDEVAAEMVYWRDIPRDAEFVSPYKNAGPEKKYLTFEPDEGGWNNLRMSMETAVTLAYNMGRTLVMPPQQGIYLLHRDDKNSKNRFTFADFFHFESVAAEHPGLEVISTEEFLKREVMTGNIVSPVTGKVPFPPKNRTNWDGMTRRESGEFASYSRVVGEAPLWNFDKCMVAFPTDPLDAKGPDRLMRFLKSVMVTPYPRRVDRYNMSGLIAPVDAKPMIRLNEHLAHRENLCVYNATYQNAPVVHMMGDNDSGARLLVHFYAFLFLEDWKQEQWTKRFVRDHLRYIDEIQCAAARIVRTVRNLAKKNGQEDGAYDSFHIRRGDFQYKDTRIPAEQIYKNAQSVLLENSTLYIATDERDKPFFHIFRKHYNIYFLDDFHHLLEGVNTNYYGMLDQLIASRGRTFVGTYYSTFTGYINRIRGYHSQKDKSEGWEQGIINSYYYVPKKNRLALQQYRPISPPMWAREFPIAWRDIDNDVEFE